MVVTSGRQNQQTRDEVGSEPTIHPIVKLKTENIIVPPLSIQTQENTLGNSWIVGSTTNGIVGTNTGTQNGLQQVVGGSGRVATISRVVNDNDTHFEVFTTRTFEDTSTTTGTWGSGELVLFAGQVGQSLSVYKDSGTATQARMIVSMGSAGTVSDLTLQMTADGGTTFGTATNNTDFTFPVAGRDLRWKIAASGSAEISQIKITYTI
jgi:hypothetical protein